MKPDEILLAEKDKLEVAVVVPYKTETLIGTIKPKKGHTLWELNPFTGICVPAKYEEIDATFPLRQKDEAGIVKKVLIKEKHIYVSALNIKNAYKQFFKKVKIQMDKRKHK